MKKLPILLLATSLVFSITAVQATSSSKLYSLKGKTSTGSLIPSIDATSTVPFNKRFEALTIKQQKMVKAKFDNLGANDTPPFPVSGLGAVYKPLLKANENYGDNSPLSVTATINSSGYVNEIIVHDSNNAKLIAYIERSLRYTRFEPASCNGVACNMDFPIEMNFN